MRHINMLRQHYGNVLHVYCRLLDMGLSRGAARRWALILTVKIA